MAEGIKVPSATVTPQACDARCQAAPAVSGVMKTCELIPSQTHEVQLGKRAAWVFLGWSLAVSRLPLTRAGDGDEYHFPRYEITHFLSDEPTSSHAATHDYW